MKLRFLIAVLVLTSNLYVLPILAQSKKREPKVESTKRAKNQPLLRARKPQIDISKDESLRNRTPIVPEDAEFTPLTFEMRRMRGTDLLQKNQQAKVPLRLQNEQRLVDHEINLRRKTDTDFGSQPVAREPEEPIRIREFRWNKQAGEIVAGLKRSHRQPRQLYQVDMVQSDFHGNLVRRRHQNSDQTRADVALDYRFDYSVKITKKDLHPSAAYLSSRYVNSFAEKEIMRYKALLRSDRQKHRKKNQPRYLRDKLKDLEYDKNEIKIWTTK